MAGYADVKRRIKSVENTRQITRTMELVATSKLKRATDRVRATRPYAEALHEIVSGLYSPSLSEKYPILRRPDVTKRAAILLCTANRGLAGGFNANLIKRARNLMEDLRGQGIGAAMMRDAEDRARAADATLMQFTSNASRGDAHRFYERLGFKATHAGFKKDLIAR